MPLDLNNTNFNYYYNTHGSDGTISSTAGDRNICNPTKPSLKSNGNRTLTVTTSSITINKTKMTSRSTQPLLSPGSSYLRNQSLLPPGPSYSYLGKRRHSTGDTMDLPPRQARRGVTSDEPTSSPPLAALGFEFSDTSFRHDSIGRVRIKVVPTSSVPAADDDDDDDEMDEHDDDHYAGSPPGPHHFQLGEPAEPRNDHSEHPLYPFENELRCSICRELMVAPHSLSCGHTFCGMCLAMWVVGPKSHCPECRAPVIRSLRSMLPIYKLDGVTELIAQNILNEQELAERHARKAEWLEFDRERRSAFRTPQTPSNLNAIRHYRALLCDQYTQAIRSIQESSIGLPKTESSPPSVNAPRIHSPAVRSQPLPIPKSFSRAN